MALPTKRSIIKFRFPPDVRFSSENTRVLNSLANVDEELGNRHFSRPADGEIKWEIAEPHFGSFYQVSFDFVLEKHTGREDESEKAN